MSKEDTISVEVVYGSPYGLSSQRVDVPVGATLLEAIERSHFLERFDEIDLETQRVGIYGNIKKLDTELKAGDRVEIYRPIICDPEAVPRRDREDAPDCPPAAGARKEASA